jgi:hypothetical protein
MGDAQRIINHHHHHHCAQGFTDDASAAAAGRQSSNPKGLNLTRHLSSVSVTRFVLLAAPLHVTTVSFLLLHANLPLATMTSLTSLMSHARTVHFSFAFRELFFQFGILCRDAGNWM